MNTSLTKAVRLGLPVQIYSVVRATPPTAAANIGFEGKKLPPRSVTKEPFHWFDLVAKGVVLRGAGI